MLRVHLRAIFIITKAFFRLMQATQLDETLSRLVKRATSMQWAMTAGWAPAHKALRRCSANIVQLAYKHINVARICTAALIRRATNQYGYVTSQALTRLQTLDVILPSPYKNIRHACCMSP